MSTAEFLDRLRGLEVKLWRDGKQLRYEAPAGIMTPALRTEIGERKAEIMALLARAQLDSRPQLPPIQPSARSQESAPSFAQNRLLFLATLRPESTEYNLARGFRLSGVLDIAALERSLNEIVNRHEVLRTSFDVIDGDPVQRIAPSLQITLHWEDLSRMDEAARARHCDALIQQEYTNPYNLNTGPLLRATLVRLADDEHMFLLGMHHIVYDGWSLGVLFRELGALYAAFAAGRESPLKPLPVQYVDYAQWQREWLQGDVLAGHLNYWRKQLRGLSTLELPTDHVRPVVQGYAGGGVSLRLPRELSEELRALSQGEGVTLFMLLLAVFVFLLHRYTGQTDIVLGSPVANRNRSELEGLIGFFVNMLTLRTDLGGNPGFRELLGRVREVALGAYEHQDLPFEKLVEEMEPERDTSRSPLLQVVFALQNAPMGALELEHLNLKLMPSEVSTTRFDLEAHLYETPEGLEVNFIYNRELFEPTTMERMLGHYSQLLETVVAEPAVCIEELELLTVGERREVLEQWNRTASAYPREQTVQALFEQQVAATPAAIAVEYEGNTLSYAQLNSQANQLAHYLQASGVGPEVMVGISVERSLEMVVGLLGILKAGGAYLPLDPDYPLSRLGFMLEDAEIKTILTTSSQRSRLPLFLGEVICLDTDWAGIAQESTDNPVSGATAENLVYVIYTSGSTGRPKGTLIEHRSVVRLVKETNFVELGPEEVFLQFAPLAFDASTFELWGSLLNGARLVIFPVGRSSLEELGRVIEEQGVTTLWLTSALFSQMVDNHLESLSGVRQLLAGGEALSLPHVKKMLAYLGDNLLINGYGPTENTTFTCCHVMTSDSELGQSVPIGRPISNTTVYVLDARMKPVPVGIPGELYIGGDGLARGYLNQPEMTAEKFVADPFSEDPQSRLYATGDQVRYRIDGSIEFIGRIDQQVKVRGYRIELGEIETALVEHSAVQDAVAIVREDEPGDKRIAAYLVPSPDWMELISSSQSGEHVDEWQALYEETYKGIDESQDLTTNFTGWNSSYTGEPIPVAEMTEWLESTVARITALQPRRVLEIGCGTGLLLYRLAPGCERYVGTDFSAVAQQQVRRVISRHDEYKNVELWQRMADDFSEVEAGDFDTVIINSVTQYLPSMDYLASVVEGAVAAIAGGGRIMLGDVRSLPLLKSYHTSVQLYLSPDEASGGELLRNIQQHVEDENELVIEPAFFHALKQRIPRLTHVEILLKQGRYHNELSGYRYDVVLHVEAQAEPLPEKGQWLDWGASGLDEARLQDRLKETGQDWLGISAIPNARISNDVTVLEHLQGEGNALSVGELRQGTESTLQQAVEPDALWRLAEETGYQLELSYSGAGADGRMDALFRRGTREACAGHVFWPQQQEVPERAWSAYGTNPLKGRLGNELIPQLRQDLQQALPEYMLPSVYVVLDGLPLNPNGKVDRKALPVPGDVRASLGAEYTAPRTGLEKQLAQIWAEILKLERVGIHDNFFDLGGHSLMATQVVSRIRGQLNVELPLSEMFGYPTVAELVPVVELLLGESDGDESDVILAVDRDGDLPLSFAQERLWFLDQLEPDSTAYNQLLAIRLKGALSETALTNSLNTIVGRHEVLRTHFSVQQGDPVQVIEDVTIELAQDDLSALTPEVREQVVKAQLNAEVVQHFDLGTGPLLRCRLLRLSGHDHVLLLTMHHIVSDGWSLGVLFRELEHCYAAFSEGQQPVLPALPIQYADFAVWQREWLSGEQLAAQQAYWQQKLADLETLNLPTDRPRSAVQTYAGARETLMLDAELSQQLELLSKQTGVTLFMTLLGGFAVLMQRYSGQDDIVVGTPVANRNRMEIEDLIGFFVNMLVLRADLSSNPDFRALLGQIQETALGAYQHQDIPFEKLVEVLQPTRDRSRNPLFQVQFALQNAPTVPLDLKGLTLEPVSQETHSTRFDLECHVWHQGAELDVVFVYNTDLYDASTIQGMLKHYRNLLQSVVAEPDRHIAEAAILSAEEERRLLDQWSQAPTDYPRTQTIHELFEQQVAATPAAIAVEYEGNTLSYAQLNSQANQLAHYLQASGVGPEVMVGISVERSLEMVVGLLGILKAGGAYLPLDPDYPLSRLGFMLEDAEIKTILTTSSQRSRLPLFLGEVICLDTDWAGIAQESTDNPVSGATAENLVYVIYTSGSTGRPKGTLIEHRSVVRLVKETNFVELGPEEVFLQFAPLAFDASTFELWGSLLNGARLVIFPVGRSSLEELGRVIEEQGVTTLWLTSALFSQMVDNHLESLSGVRQLLAGGEALSLPHVKKMLAYLGDNLLINGYGPTENTTFTCCHVMTSDSELGQSVPIGRPISNTTVYVLDARMKPVPVGIPGELYIGGDGLARGYLNQPEMTAEKFVADPFSEDPQSRLYATGDQVRYRIDGSIEFIGRIDQQIKLRGFRIELGEIESLLCQHSEVREAVVLCRDDEVMGKRLFAYVVADGSGEPSVVDLRAYVRQKLPEYMVPSAFTVLDHIPLTENGKLDRRALPAPGDIREGLESEYTAPRTELEQQLTQIWAQILKIESVGIHDNFFDLGGHSLMATQIVSCIREQLNVELPLSEMFGYPTVAELAPVMESLLDESDGNAVDVISTVDRDGELPLSFAQERLWVLDQLEPGNIAYNQPLAIRLKGELSVTALTNSLNTIVGRQEALRTHFSMQRGSPTQVIENVTIELALDDFSALVSEVQELKVKARLNEEALRPFDLSTGPLLRSRLLRLSGHDHVLSLIMHHVISDGWSLGVLFRELEICYAAFSKGEQPVLAELPIQYADFAVWQRQWLSGEQLETQQAYWQLKLSDLEMLNLPTDHPRPEVQTYIGAYQALTLDTELTGQLERLSKQAGVTLFMTLLGGFAVLMHRYSGQDDVVVGSPIANRNRSEVEELIGFFVNMLVLRMDVSGSAGFRNLLGQVKETALGAYQHQDIPFEKLVEVLQPTRDRSRNPLFQVQFALQNAPMEPLELQGLTLEPVSSEAQSTRFDLECNIWQRDAELDVVFVYNTDLYDAATIQRMQIHYRSLLKSLVMEPEQSIDLLPMLSSDEKLVLLEHWNNSYLDYPRDVTLPQLFEAQVERSLEATALVHEGESLSYSELNEQANRLAHYLIASGVKADAAVVVLMERTPNLIIAQLAALKAGGAYVAIDPDYPIQRLGFILEDTRSPVLLTQSSLSARVTDYQGHRLCLDVDSDTLSAQSTQNPGLAVSAENLAYIIYTSGSTGTPKGVEIPHRGLMNLVNWHRRAYEVSSADRATHLAGLGFDASVWELWPYLASGASLYLVSDDQRLSPASLWSWMAAQGITLSFLPTPLAEAVLREPIGDDLKLRVLLTGGDRLHGGLVNNPVPFRVVNHYGPTENSVVATCTEVDVCSTEDPPIGRPIDNVQAYVLDQGRQPVPVGVWGELYIGGESLARGYLNNPELTAEKFVANPFSDEAGARLYRSGDLVRYREDGQIEFKGRIDNQVKVRGFRVELGEIEALLCQHDTVREAVVLCWDEDVQGQRLVAYITAHGSEEPAAADIRAYVRQKLPEYMVPSAFMVLDSFPLSANGKLDRKQLPLPSRVQKHAEAVNNKPESNMEIIMANIWEELLEIDDIEKDDMFFDLGGYSMLIFKVVDRFADETNVQIPPANIISQTLRQLAAFAEASVKVSDKSSDDSVSGSIYKDGSATWQTEVERLRLKDGLK